MWMLICNTVNTLPVVHLADQIKTWLCSKYVCISVTHHQRRDDFVRHLFHCDHISAGLGVDDAFFFLPSHHDGFLPVSNAAHPLLFALCSQSGVGIGGDHGWDWVEGKEIWGESGWRGRKWKENKISVKTFRSLFLFPAVEEVRRVISNIPYLTVPLLVQSTTLEIIAFTVFIVLKHKKSNSITNAFSMFLVL